MGKYNYAEALFKNRLFHTFSMALLPVMQPFDCLALWVIYTPG